MTAASTHYEALCARTRQVVETAITDLQGIGMVEGEAMKLF